MRQMSLATEWVIWKAKVRMGLRMERFTGEWHSWTDKIPVQTCQSLCQPNLESWSNDCPLECPVLGRDGEVLALLPQLNHWLGRALQKEQDLSLQARLIPKGCRLTVLLVSGQESFIKRGSEQCISLPATCSKNCQHSFYPRKGSALVIRCCVTNCLKM